MTVLMVLSFFKLPVAIANDNINPIPRYDDWKKNTSFTFISDSLLVGTSDHLRMIAPNASVDSLADRELFNYEDNSRKDAFKSATTSKSPVVFIAMGTDSEVTMTEVNDFINGVFEKNKDVTNIVFITSGSNTEFKNSYNSSIKNISESNQNIYIIDWEDVALKEGMSNVYEKSGKYLLYPDKFYEYALEETYNQMVNNMPLVVKEEIIEIPFPEIVKYNPNARENSEVVSQDGEDGKKIVKLTYNTFMGMTVGSPVVEEVIVKEPTPKIKIVGKGTVSESVVEEIKTIPFETINKENKFLESGITRVIQAGVPGTMSIKKTMTLVGDTQEGEPTIEEKVLTEPVDEIIEVGIGIKEIKEDVQIVEIPFETKTINDELLLEGEQVVAQEGVVGEKEVITKTPLFNGEVAGDPVKNEKVIKDPVNKIIKIGTAKEESALYDNKQNSTKTNNFSVGIIVMIISFLLIGVGGVLLYIKLVK